MIVSAAMRVSEAQRGLLNCPPGYRALDCLCAPQPDGECHYLWGSVRYSTSCYSYFLQNPNNTILATALCRPGACASALLTRPSLNCLGRTKCESILCEW